MSNEEGPPPAGGWQAIDEGAFDVLAGPLYVSSENLRPDEPIRIGFRVLPKHCNFTNTCHGGMMATFLDVALGSSVHAITKETGPTMSLTIDFLGAALPGEWIESRTRFVHQTYRTGFCDVIALGPNGPVARASGMWRITRPKA